MLNEIVTDRRAWTSETVDDFSEWCYTLSDSCLSELDGALKEHVGSISTLQISEATRLACEQCLRPALEALQSGRGFAIIEHLPVEYYSVEEAQAAYWLVGQYLGLPIGQNIEGTLLYDVRDTGQDVKEGARFSVTNSESSFHTDGAFGTQVPEVVGLLCLKTAQSGGRSQLISAYAVHNALHEQAPEVLEALYTSFCFDRRGQVLPGEDAIKKTPVFSLNRESLIMRYLRFYIDVGHREADVPLTFEQERALDAVDELLKQPEMCVEFDLKPGQMLFTNNNWILHNRTAFEDYADFEQRRHYVRLWLMEK